MHFVFYFCMEELKCTSRTFLFLLLMEAICILTYLELICHGYLE